MKKITLTLDKASIDKAIREVEDYEKWMQEKAKELQRRVAEEIASNAQSAFAVSVVDDLLTGGARTANVTVSIGQSDGVTLVIANGEDAIWCEFGSGIYHNTPVGTSPHPKGAEFGFTIGSFGKGFGSRKVWGFYRNGELNLTHGTQAQMPMYNAVKTVGEKIVQIAKGVFAD